MRTFFFLFILNNCRFTRHVHSSPVWPGAEQCPHGRNILTISALPACVIIGRELLPRLGPKDPSASAVSLYRAHFTPSSTARDTRKASQSPHRTRQNLSQSFLGSAGMAMLPHPECMTAQPVTEIGHLTHLTVLCDLHLFPLRHLGNMEVALWDPQQERTPRSIRGKQTEGNTKHPLPPSCLAAFGPGE